jgi:hypothetical protein
MVLNTIGYYSLLVIVRNKLTGTVTEKIQSASHEPGGQMILKVPVLFPYTMSSGEYQPTSGEIAYEGVIYQFIKKKIYHDTLYVICIKDYQVTEATNQLKDLSKTFTSENKEQNQAVKIPGSSAEYFFMGDFSMFSSHNGWSLSYAFADVPDFYQHQLKKNIFHPPPFTT